MEQYLAIKSTHPDKLLLFRLGDFFELFFEDALQAAPLLNLTLTQRNKKSNNQTPMCGFPYYTLSQQVNKLLEAGHKVVIYDQVEPSSSKDFSKTSLLLHKAGETKSKKTGKKITYRAITHVLTPGMIYDSDTLQSGRPHYLASVDACSISFMDLSTGECFYFLEDRIENKNIISLEEISFNLNNLLEILPVAELVQPTSWEKSKEQNKNPNEKKQEKHKEYTEQKPQQKSSPIQNSEKKFSKQNFPVSYFDALELNPEAKALLPKEFAPSSTLAPSVPSSPLAPSFPKTIHTLLSYVAHLGGKGKLLNLKPFYKRDFLNYMGLSANTLRHLEVLQDYRGESLGSLYGAIRRTKTASGARLLRQWLCFPLQNVTKLNERLDQIQWWIDHKEILEQVQSLLRPMGDLERILSKVIRPQCSPRDMLNLAQSLELLQKVYLLIEQSPHSFLASQVEEAKKVSQEILQTLVENPPNSCKEEGIIRRGVNAELDAVISLTDEGQQHLLEMEAIERQKTGIPSLKIRYNSVFGYYIEVTHTHKDKVPKHYLRKQTLAQVERFSMENLRELEAKILNAQNERLQIEQALFSKLQKGLLTKIKTILHLASNSAHLDVISSLAWLAIEQNYCRPQFLIEEEAQRKSFLLKQNRHPVVEQKSSAPFIPNDFRFSSKSCLLLTGPNMAGKSTFMRQVALSVLMAQIGSFVPAKEAKLPIFDRIFTRIGAGDHLTEGLSTFMVEMKETSEMLKKATNRSLLVLDEVGRGTSTFDGLSLAQAILEYILNTCQSYTLFATHYHELTKMAKFFPQLVNAHMLVEGNPQSGHIEFLYHLSEGATNQSYGIHVAKLAGLPSSITQRAENLLKNLEKRS